jgi:hypothetical protein
MSRSARPAWQRAIHVVHGTGVAAWRVRTDASPAYVAESPTQAQAVYVASRIAEAHAPSVLVVHGADGRVEAERVYSRAAVRAEHHRRAS